MPSFFYARGVAQARADTGTAKIASEPEMGDAMYEHISSATGDEGRTRIRSNEDPRHQAGTYMDEHDRHMVRDLFDGRHEFPVGAQQSPNTKLAEISYDALVESAPVPVHPHESMNSILGQGAFLTHDHDGIKAPAIIMDPENPRASVLAHEIGHAQSHENALGKFLHHPASRMAGNLAPLAALAAGRFAPTPLSKVLGVGALTAGLSAPTLIGEGIADYKGYQHLKEQGATDEELAQYIKELIPAQASYLAMPALSLAGGALGAKLAAHKLHGRRKFRNLNISIENRKGSSRHWYDPHEDRHGSTVQKYPYGYIRMTEGMDGEHIDCYVGPHENAKNVYVVTTNKAPDFKKIDEQKCMLGFSSATAARKAFMQHYANPGFFRSMKAIPYEKFEKKVLATLHGKQKKVATDKTASRLRKAFKLVEESLDPADLKLLAQEGIPHSVAKPGVRNFNAVLGDKNIGVLSLQRDPTGAYFVGGSLIDSPYQGLGLGKKMYGEAMRLLPDQQLASGASAGYGTSNMAQRVWKTMTPEKGYHTTDLGGGRFTSRLPEAASHTKKASNRYQSDDDRLIDNSPGTTHNQVPGDYLGFPPSNLLGLRSIKGGNPEDPSDTIDRMFRFQDHPMDSRVLEGDTSALPADPGV